MKYTCPCCGYKTFDHNPDGSYDICPICFWEDDLIPLTDPNYEYGANGVSLKQAQKNYIKFRACKDDVLQHVRQATKDDVKDTNWKLLD
jgi:hypothetical protein